MSKREGGSERGIGRAWEKEWKKRERVRETHMHRHIGDCGIMVIVEGYFWGARGVVVIVVGNGHGDTSSNPGRDWLHFT